MPDSRTVELDPHEVALIVGEEDGSMTVRVVPATELQEGATDIPEPYRDCRGAGDAAAERSGFS